LLIVGVFRYSGSRGDNGEGAICSPVIGAVPHEFSQEWSYLVIRERERERERGRD
jgi:hypothetical protein